MNKRKFASLIMLSAFSAGVASSSAVSAQGDENLASVVDNIGTSSHDDSVSIDPKVSNEPVVAADETKIDTETTTDEETKNAITDENNYARNDAENLDENIEDETDLPKVPDKESSESRDYVFVTDDKKQNVKNGNGVETVKGSAIAGIGASAVSGAAFGISKLVKSSGNGKKDEPEPKPEPDPEPKPEPKPDPEPKPEPNKKEEKGGFGVWYKNNLLISLPVTFVVGYIFVAIISAIRGFAFDRGKSTTFYYAPLRGRLGFKRRTVESIPKALWYEFWSALTLSVAYWGEYRGTE